MNDDTPTGFDRAPDRYMGQGRETIDRMRDAAGELFERATQHGLSIGDAAFYVHCVLTAMKYEDRAGRKGDAREDNEKAMWYRRMANHLLGFGPDPRARASSPTRGRREPARPVRTPTGAAMPRCTRIRLDAAGAPRRCTEDGGPCTCTSFAGHLDTCACWCEVLARYTAEHDAVGDLPGQDHGLDGRRGRDS